MQTLEVAISVPYQKPPLMEEWVMYSFPPFNGFTIAQSVKLQAILSSWSLVETAVNEIKLEKLNPLIKYVQIYTLCYE